MKRYFKSVLICLTMAVMMGAGILIGATGSLDIPIPYSTATNGDIVYISVSGTVQKLTNLASTTLGSLLYSGGAGSAPAFLTPGANGTVLSGSSTTTAPTYAAKNTWREVTQHNFATLAASWTLTDDEALCYLLTTTNANGSATIRLPSTGGKKFFIRNGSGQNNVLLPAGNGSGITLATAKAIEVIYDTASSEYLPCSTFIVSPHTP